MSDETSNRKRDIENVMREERSRSKKHIDTAAEEKYFRLRTAFLDAARDADNEEDFLKATDAFELPPEQTQKALRAWREMKQRGR